MRVGIHVGPFFASTDTSRKRRSRDGNAAVVYLFAAAGLVIVAALLALWFLVAVIGGAVAAAIDRDGYLRNVRDIWNLLLGGTRLRISAA